MNRKIIETYYVDICNISDLLTKLVNSYRLLIGGAGELNTIALAKKSDVKDALDRVDKLGDIIDDLIEVLDHSDLAYLQYCRLKSDYLKMKVAPPYIQTEIDEELEFENSEREEKKV